MTGIAFAVPGDLDLPTGGYAYDRRILAEWREMGVVARHLPLPGGFPRPDAAALARTEAALAAAGADEVLLIDGLAYGAFPAALAGRFGARTVALVHHPLAHESGLAAEEAARLKASETAALARAAAIVATSPATKRLLVAEYRVPEAKIAVACPGTDPAPRATGSRGDGPALLAVGAVIPRKGYALLIEALAALRDRPWRLTIVGALDHDPATATALRARIDAAGLADRIVLAGTVAAADLAGAYATADLFVMPSLFEGYGMALAEALARGLPILCTTGCAAAETLSDAAAAKIPPGDAPALLRALAALLGEEPRRRAMADAAWHAAKSLPRWRDSAGVVATACLKVAR